jgi:prepilin-type N-terminal cleavage/methylation domain-containing protein
LRPTLSNLRKEEKGFTLLELLVVMILIVLMFSLTLPISSDMVHRYKAAIRAQEVMVYVSGLRRDAFLYSQRHILDSRNSILTVDGKDIPFADVLISVEEPIFFYRNGATSSGRIRIIAGEERYILYVTAPFGTLNLEAEEKTA